MISHVVTNVDGYIWPPRNLHACRCVRVCAVVIPVYSFLPLSFLCLQLELNSQSSSRTLNAALLFLQDIANIVHCSTATTTVPMASSPGARAHRSDNFASKKSEEMVHKNRKAKSQKAPTACPSSSLRHCASRRDQPVFR